MARHHHIAQQEHEEESYFVSMTDMMVGLLFIFILMLMYFALQYQKSTENLQNAEDTRTEILYQIKEHLEKQNIKVTVDEESGILRLPEESLRFPSGRAEISVEDKSVIGSLATALSLVLPCYAVGNVTKPADCPKTAHNLEAVFIEGHTDSDTFQGNAGADYNWELSTARAVNTYRDLIHAKPELDNLKNADNDYLLSVSGYGSKRRITSEKTDEEKKQNRRIDLRFVMATPKNNSTQPVIQSVEEGLQ